MSATFSPDGRRILTSGYQPDHCQLWSAPSGKPIGSAYEHVVPPSERTDIILHAAISPDGKTAALAGYDGWAVLWPLPVADERPVGQILVDVQCALNAELDEGGGRQTLDGRAWRALAERQRRH